MNAFDTKILEVLVCPKTKKPLTYNQESQELINEDNTLAYPIINNRPILVPWIDENSSRSNELLHAVNSLKERSKDPYEEVKEKDLIKRFFNVLFPKLNPRDPHWKFLGRKAASLDEKIPLGSKVLDVGSGECLYGKLLPGRDYIGTDLVFSSDKHDFTPIDIVSDAHNLPFHSESFDYVLNMVLMEHVSEPDEILSEMNRVLKINGKVFALIPLVRPEHLQPFDFYRYTRFGIEHIFKKNGFGIKSIEPSNGSLWTAISYASIITTTRPLVRFGSRSLLGVILNRFWRIIFLPLIFYSRITDKYYPDDFPMYFWVEAEKK